MAAAGPGHGGAHGASMLTAVLLGSFCADIVAAQVETPLDVLAVRVREQGHVCEKPVKAERDESASTPNRTVWRLECTNASYRIVLHPDMGAEIKVID